MEPDTALTALARVLLYSDLPMQVIYIGLTAEL